MNSLSKILTLEQLQSATSAFDSFVTVGDSDLPDYYKSIFPTHCDCGGEVIMTRDTVDSYGYTQLQCCNPDCWIKFAHRFAYFAKHLGYKGVGAAGSLQVFSACKDKLEYPTFLSIFLLDMQEVRMFGGTVFADVLTAMKEDFATKGFQFKDAIVALGIPGLGKGSTFFDVVKDPTVLLDRILKNRLGEICDIAGIQAPKTRFYLEISKIDILILMKYVMQHILSTPKKEINVAITGSVSVRGKALTRAEFISLCESLQESDGSQAYKLFETKSSSKLDYVIADSPSSSSKYELGKKLNCLITADDFYSILEESIGGNVE